MLQQFLEQLGNTSAIPADNCLFTVQDEVKTQYLPGDQEQNFRFTVAKLLLISSRECKYINMAMVYLTMHMKNQTRTNGEN